MAGFAYNNIKNANTGYTLFDLNYSYHLHIFLRKHWFLYLIKNNWQVISQTIRIDNYLL